MVFSLFSSAILGYQVQLLRGNSGGGGERVDGGW